MKLPAGWSLAHYIDPGEAGFYLRKPSGAQIHLASPTGIAVEALGLALAADGEGWSFEPYVDRTGEAGLFLVGGDGYRVPFANAYATDREAFILDLLDAMTAPEEL